jgi:signal transduction histidine kinase
MTNIKTTPTISNLEQTSYFDKVLHELATPINGILNLSDVLHTEWKNLIEDDRQACIKDIWGSAQTLADLINALREMHNFQSSKIRFNFAEMDIISIVENSLSSVSYRMEEKSLQSDLIKKMNVCIATIDKIWFKQLLVNLLNNAINHTETGIISVHVDVVKTGKSNNLHIAVKDQGVGIKEDELEIIFEPLKRGRNSIGKIKGSGIGLALCKEIIESHRGKIWARNNEYKGATVELSIPLD